MRQVGYTLVELSVVVVILAVVAAAVIRSQTSADVAPTLDAAAEEVAAALRFARSEAIRNGEPHGVDASTSTQRVRIYRLDTSVSPPVPDYSSVRHPVDKQLYHLDFSTHPLLAPVAMTTVAVWWVGLGVGTSFVGFSPSGTPKYDSGSGIKMLSFASITLEAGGETREIKVAPMTGRVTVE
jgi:prepilin-type N-terminal cleavage/methylation domain-containing protein